MRVVRNIDSLEKSLKAKRQRKNKIQEKVAQARS